MKKYNRVIAFLSVTIMLLTMGTVVSFAAEQPKSEYRSAQELAAAMDAQLEQQGVTVLGGKIGRAYLTTASNLKESPYVEVIWRIGYGATVGLNFYTQAYSTPLTGVKLKAMSGHHYWKVIEGTGYDSDKGFSVRAVVPERKIHHTMETGFHYSKGTELECESFVDVDGVGEIIGGEWTGSDTVTIP